LVVRIADLVREKVIEGIRDVRDESDENTRIVIELKRGEQSQIVINQLYQQTALESSFGVTLLALDKKRPKQMNIRELLDCYIEHRRDVVTRRSKHRLQSAEDRAHVLEGYIVALDNLDDFVRSIRSAPSRDSARTDLQARYKLSDTQIDHILELRLYQLTGMERGRIDADHVEQMKLVTEYRSILESESILLALIKKELVELRAKYATPRCTVIAGAAADIRMEDVIPNEGCVITLSHLGFIKRTPVADYRSQKRGGKGVVGAETYDADFVENFFTASTHDNILFLTSSGQCHVRKVYDIPEGARQSKGKSVSSVLKMGDTERVASLLCVKAFSDEQQIVMVTKNGLTKKTALSEYANATREGGLRGIKLEEGDALVGCVLVQPANELILVSYHGQAVRFVESDLRSMGRDTMGVTGMRFKHEGDFVKAIEVCKPTSHLLVAREDGIGKRTTFDEYRLTSRGGTGVIAIDLPEDGSVNVAGALRVDDADEVMILTAKGQSIRTQVGGIRAAGRGAKGVRLLNLSEGDKVLAIARVVDNAEAEPPASQDGTPPPPPATEDSVAPPQAAS
jgi:DNA gyrase subunit A